MVLHKHSSRQDAALKFLEYSERQSFDAEGARRIYLLRIFYEVNRLQDEADRGGYRETCHRCGARVRTAFWIERESNKVSPEIQSLLHHGLSQCVNGLGILLMLGLLTRNL